MSSGNIVGSNFFKPKSMLRRNDRSNDISIASCNPSFPDNPDTPINAPNAPPLVPANMLRSVKYPSARILSITP
jgi:hypothetical protein